MYETAGFAISGLLPDLRSSVGTAPFYRLCRAIAKWSGKHRRASRTHSHRASGNDMQRRD